MPLSNKAQQALLQIRDTRAQKDINRYNLGINQNRSMFDNPAEDIIPGSRERYEFSLPKKAPTPQQTPDAITQAAPLRNRIDAAVQARDAEIQRHVGEQLTQRDIELADTLSEEVDAQIEARRQQEARMLSKYPKGTKPGQIVEGKDPGRITPGIDSARKQRIGDALSRGVDIVGKAVGFQSMIAGEALKGLDENDPFYRVDLMTGMPISGVPSKQEQNKYLWGVLDNLSKSLKDTGRETMEYWGKHSELRPQDERLIGNVVDKPELLKSPDWWMTSIAEMAPALGAAMIAHIAFGPAGSFIFGGTMEGAGTYEEAIQRGQTEQEAIDKGMKMAMAAGMLNAISTGEMLNKSGRTALSRFIHTGKSALLEGGTEAAEEPAEGMIFGEDWEQFKGRLKDAITVFGPAAVTGAGGSIFGGGTTETPSPTNDTTQQPFTPSSPETMEAIRQETAPETSQTPPPVEKDTGLESVSEKQVEKPKKQKKAKPKTIGTRSKQGRKFNIIQKPDGTMELHSRKKDSKGKPVEVFPYSKEEHRKYENRVAGALKGQKTKGEKYTFIPRKKFYDYPALEAIIKFGGLSEDTEFRGELADLFDGIVTGKNKIGAKHPLDPQNRGKLDDALVYFREETEAGQAIGENNLQYIDDLLQLAYEEMGLLFQNKPVIYTGFEKAAQAASDEEYKTIASNFNLFRDYAEQSGIDKARLDEIEELTGKQKRFAEFKEAIDAVERDIAAGVQNEVKEEVQSEVQSELDEDYGVEPTEEELIQNAKELDDFFTQFAQIETPATKAKKEQPTEKPAPPKRKKINATPSTAAFEMLDSRTREPIAEGESVWILDDTGETVKQSTYDNLTLQGEQETLDVGEKKKAGREPWQMTLVEFAKSQLPAKTAEQINSREQVKSYEGQHRKEVDAGLSNNKPVPPEVIKEYPDLAEKYKIKIPKAKDFDETGYSQQEDKQQNVFGELVGQKDDLFAGEQTPEQAQKPVSILGTPIDEEKAATFRKDIDKGRDYSYKFEIGEQVESEGKKYIVGSKYIQDGEARYTVYPPGKKKSLGYHVWIRESELNSRKTKKSKPDVEPIAKPDDIPFKTAEQAYRGTSFTPDKRATDVQQDYVDDVNGLYEELSKEIAPEQQDQLREEIERYKNINLRKRLDLLSSHSRLMSTMIAGPANFPARQQQKRHDSYMNKNSAFVEWRQKARDRIRKNLGLTGGKEIISSDEADAPQQLRQKIDDLKAKQERMKEINAAWRKGDKTIDSLQDLNLTDKEKAMLNAHIKFGDDVQPYASYELTNNNANIKRLEGRLKEIERSRDAETQEFSFDGGTVIDNVEDNRVQILFDKKPDNDMRDRLKKRAFKWAPSKGVWQRQRTRDALNVAMDITGAKSQDKYSTRDVTETPDTGKPQASKTTGGMPFRSEPKPAKTINKTDIITKTEDMFGVPLRMKATHRWKAAGMYYPKKAIVRMQKWGDLATLTHEVAHHIDTIMKKANSGWKSMLASNTKERIAIFRELKALDYDQGQRRISEGFAEFIRHYTTTGEAKTLAPTFHRLFEQKFFADNPAMAENIKELRRMMDVWRDQGAEARMLAQIDMRGEHTELKGTVKKTKRLFRKIINHISDEFYGVQQTVKEVEKIINRPLKPSEDPAKLAQLAKSKAGAKARTFVMNAAIDIYGNPVGKSLVEILEPIEIKNKTEMEKFIVYGIAKRAYQHLHPELTPPIKVKDEKTGEMKTLKKGVIDDGFDARDIDYVLNKYQNDTWDKALDEITTWSRQLLDLVVQAGGLSEYEAEIIHALNPIYLPMKRAFLDDTLQVFKGSGGFLNRGKFIKSARGSGRPVINPIESLVSQATETILAAEKMNIVSAWAKLAYEQGVGGIITDDIPAPMSAMTVPLRNIVDLKDTLDEMGYDTNELDLNKFATVMFQSPKYYGKENIFSIWVNAERKWFELDKELADALAGVDMIKLGPVLHVMSKFARLQRAGFTGVRLSFPVTNVIRDALFSPVASKRMTATPLDSFIGMRKETTAKKGEPLWRYLHSGGKLSGMLGYDRAATMDVYDELVSAKLGKMGKTLRVSKHPIQNFQEAISFGEMGPRSQEFTKMYEKYMAERDKTGWTEEDIYIQAFLDASDVTVDFTKSGRTGKKINQVIPFWNVSIRGMDKVQSTLRARPVQTTIKGIAYLTLLSMFMHWRNRDKEWYKNLPLTYKYNSLFFETGDAVGRVPLPYDFGAIFAAAPMAAYDAMTDKETEPLNAWFEIIQHQMPEMVPAVINPAKEVATNKNWLDAPIESEGMKYQYFTQRKRFYTTDAAKWLSNSIDVINKSIPHAVNIPELSPVQIDHLIEGYTGGMFSQFSFRRNREKGDLPVLRAFILRMKENPRRQLNEFYLEWETLAGKKNSGIATKDELRRYEVINKYQKEVSRVLREIRSMREDDVDVKYVKKAYTILGKILNKYEATTQ